MASLDFCGQVNFLDTSTDAWHQDQPPLILPSGISQRAALYAPAKVGTEFLFSFSCPVTSAYKEVTRYPSLSLSLFFGYAGSSLLFQAFSSCGQQELLSSCGARAFHCSVFSCCRAWAPGRVGPVVVALGLVAPSMWDLPRPGIEPLTLALASRIFTTGPPGKSPPVSRGLVFCILGTWWALAFLLFVLECFFFNPLIGWACNSIYWPRYVSSLPGTQIHFFITFSRGQGWGGAFKGYLHLFSCPQGKKKIPVSKVTCSFFSETLLSRNTYLFLLGGGPSLPSGVLLFLRDLFHSGNLKSLGLKHDLLHEAVKQDG